MAQHQLQAARSCLHATGWLAVCPADFADALLSYGRLRHLDRGEPLHHVGDKDGGIWGIVSGQVISSTGIAGPNTSLTAVLLPGEWIGTAPISGFPRYLDLAARIRTTLVGVPQWSVQKLLSDHPQWWVHLNTLHFQLMVKFGLLAADLQVADSRARVAGVLLSAAGLRVEGNRSVSVAASQEEVGRMANLSRYPTGNILREFVQQGIIYSKYGIITIVSPEKLREIAELR